MTLLLAPGGSPEAVASALDAGADAVYVELRGWSRGGARSELEWPEIDASARSARAHGAELQVALNTIPRPREEVRLRAAVPRLLDMGVRTLIVNDIYVTTYAAPRGGDVDRLRRALTAARAAGALAAEVHGPGLARLVRDEFPELALHVGSFANVYTGAGAAVYGALGAVRIAPPTELPLDEVAVLAAAGGVRVEVTVHGKVPLGVSDSCLLLGCESALGAECPDLCRRDVFLSRDDWVLKSVGTGVLSGRDACLLEHLPRLVADGHRHFRRPRRRVFDEARHAPDGRPHDPAPGSRRRGW